MITAFAFLAALLSDRFGWRPFPVLLVSNVAASLALEVVNWRRLRREDAHERAQIDAFR